MAEEQIIKKKKMLKRHMTNNNWEQEFETRYKKSEIMKYLIHTTKYNQLYIDWFPDDVKAFISNLLLQKDQEHKEELEKIKKEIRNLILEEKKAKAASDIEKIAEWYKIIGINDVISIIDNHINKLK